MMSSALAGSSPSQRIAAMLRDEFADNAPQTLCERKMNRAERKYIGKQFEGFAGCQLSRPGGNVLIGIAWTKIVIERSPSWPPTMR